MKEEKKEEADIPKEEEKVTKTVVEKEDFRKKYEETKDLLQRMQAEFDNFRKRSEKDKQLCKSTACADVLIALLPVLDSFDHALKSTEDAGIKILHSQLSSALKQKGLSRMDPKGDFDPHIHEVLLQEESEAPEGKIIEVLQPGYAINGVIIRHAKVKVSKGKRRKDEVDTSDKGNT
jgi:molecular chaperone GrpE